MTGQQVVIVTLGISENPIRVRFFGTASTLNNVRSAGTRNVITAMRKHGVQRLVVQSSYGVGETRGLLRFVDQLFFSLILKPQIEDTEIQEQVVRDSGVDWVIAQPVHLTDEDSSTIPFLSTKGETRLMKVARKSVARFLALAAS
ncbi:NAD(P)-binding oxidoreductase [Methyloprofundus sp.]|uniref:NAD(P)-binding oxidoreductase n=1 Tax=Methyloprofundus sp. TaxID=2020875 RepID=UPI003D0CF08F